MTRKTSVSTLIDLSRYGTNTTPCYRSWPLLSCRPLISGRTSCDGQSPLTPRPVLSHTSPSWEAEDLLKPIQQPLSLPDAHQSYGGVMLGYQRINATGCLQGMQQRWYGDRGLPHSEPGRVIRCFGKSLVHQPTYRRSLYDPYDRGGIPYDLADGSSHPRISESFLDHGILHSWRFLLRAPIEQASIARQSIR